MTGPDVEPEQCAGQCDELIIADAANVGVEVSVIVEPHIYPVDDRYPPLVLVCLHGTCWLIRPTEAQIAKWHAEQAP